MRVLILTSKNHPYANLLLGKLLRSDILKEATIIVGEQSAIVPKKSIAVGLMQYLRTAGFTYVLVHMCKTYIFVLSRFLLRFSNKTCAPFYPYWKQAPVRRISLNNSSSAPTIQRIRSLKPDLILSLLSKEILPQSIIELPSAGCWNIHPSLLPQYKGVSPTFWVLADKARYTGVTLHAMDTGIDTGDIISQASIPLNAIDSEHKLYMHCMIQGFSLLQDALTKVLHGEPIHTHKQTQGGNYYSLPNKQAIRAFKKNGYCFFNLKQFLVSGFSCKNTN